MKLEVSCYAGRKAEERPVRFRMEDHEHLVEEILDQWYKSLVDSGGTATLRQLAQHFLSEDKSQLLYYEKCIKEMPREHVRLMSSGW